MGYVFDPARLCEISKIGIGLPRREIFQVITDELARSFPGRITTEPNGSSTMPGVRWVC